MTQSLMETWSLWQRSNGNCPLGKGWLSQDWEDQNPAHQDYKREYWKGDFKWQSCTQKVLSPFHKMKSSWLRRQPSAPHWRCSASEPWPKKWGNVGIRWRDIKKSRAGPRLPGELFPRCMHTSISSWCWLNAAPPRLAITLDGAAANLRDASLIFPPHWQPRKCIWNS